MATNYERIKAMSAREMTELINCCFCIALHKFRPCKVSFIKKLCEEINQDGLTTEIRKEKIKQWLESEAENDR